MIVFPAVDFDDLLADDGPLETLTFGDITRAEEWHVFLCIWFTGTVARATLC